MRLPIALLMLAVVGCQSDPYTATYTTNQPAKPETVDRFEGTVGVTAQERSNAPVAVLRRTSQQRKEAGNQHDCFHSLLSAAG